MKASVCPRDIVKRLEPAYFRNPAELLAWFEEHHATADQLILGFYKRGSGEPSVTWPEAVDVALCFGWIDGVRKGIDDRRYQIRFTPRRAGSIWSTVNVNRVAELQRQGRMRAEGLKAFAGRQAKRSGIYSYERDDHAPLSGAQEQEFRADPAAWRFFEAQPPGYRRQLTFWVTSAKQEATRAKRLRTLIDACAQGRRLR